jgi:hypothetical protein
VVAGWDADEYKEMEHNLEGLMVGIPEMSIEEVPRHFQHHIVGVSGSLSRLLHRVAWAIVFYHERHP